MTSPSTGETEIETSANAAPPKSNRISTVLNKSNNASNRIAHDPALDRH